MLGTASMVAEVPVRGERKLACKTMVPQARAKQCEPRATPGIGW
jgi:hypothetical protein